MAKKLTSEKAKEILRDKSVHGNPLTEKQRKFFGAIAGGAKPYKAEDGGWLDRYETPSAQTGITTCPPGFVNIEGKCFDRSSDAYKKLYQYGIGYMDDKDVLVSSRMDLPEVVIKPKAALDFLDRIDASDRTRYSFDQMTKKFGAIPNIKPKGKSSFIAEELFKFFDPSNKDRELSRTATYDPFTKTARVDNMEEYISELAHHADKNILESAPYRFLRYDLPNRLKGKNLYHVPGTAEYIAHSIIEPQIKDLINKNSRYVDEILLPRIIGSRSPEERKIIMDEAWTKYVPPTENKKREGGVLKQKTTDNYGTKPNANNSDVSLPPGFKGWAYNTKGRNYSPAWGGQFAMGGNLPGATGMMYARTINPAPSNGPYAKKTKASAQNGQEMKFYQEGLDFTPKTISQNGRNITTDINDYNRWKDSVKNYIKGQTDLAKSRSAVKKNIDSFSLLKSSDIVGAFTNLIKGDEEGKRRVFPKYSEKAIPKKYWYSEGREEQQPMSVMTIGDNAYDTHKYIPGLTKSIDDTAGDYWKRENAAAPYLDIVALYHPPVRKNLQYVKPSKPAPKKPVQPVIVEKEPKLEKPIPIPRDTRDLGYSLPTPGTPSFPKLQEYNPNTPTKYTFTYPTGKYNEQKTMYFPTKSALKAFTQGVRGATYQEGDSWASATGTLQDGGNVDSMGYWNPDNWGKPVTIPSNEITMQGVYEPLIGISDTGDVQYMEPGEDYTFDGNYVTEYPMAKGGISVNEADAQPIKKLDQLLNFTNYNKPTKGGWLDKYQ